MSTTVPAPTNGHSKRDDSVRTYRGRNLEDLIPRIKEELGPDAIILREREGLMGGINGFFAQRFVEIEARAGAPRIDLYDEEPFEDDSFASRLEDASIPLGDDPRPTPRAASVPSAAAPTPELDDPAGALLPEPIADAELDEIDTEPEGPPAAIAEPELPKPITPAPAPEPAVAPAPAPAPKARRRGPHLRRNTPPAPRRETDASAASAVMGELSASGISPAWAQELIGEAGAHFGPFAQTSLRDAVRGAIAGSLASSRPLPSTGAAVAFVGTGGAGKSRCAATLAAAYRQGSTLPVTVVSLAGTRAARALADLLKSHGVPVASVSDGRVLARRVAKSRAGGLVVIDTGATVPSDAAGVASLAAQLAPLSLDSIVLALPATLGMESAKRLLIGLSPLGTTGIAITHIDETDQLGVAIELAAATRTPISYLHEGLDLDRALSAPNPFSLAERLLP